jgi:hypothetical protein
MKLALDETSSDSDASTSFSESLRYVEFKWFWKLLKKPVS